MVGRRDFTLFWSWKTWLGGWMLRIVSQAGFYTMIGQVIGSHATVRFLLIGNAVVVGSLAANWAVASATWDRFDGVHALQVAAPTSLVPVRLGRSAVWLLNGIATSTLALIALSLIFGVRLALPSALGVIPLLVATCLSTYCFGSFLGGLVARVPSIRNLTHISATLVLTAICGVSVPLTFWPSWVQWIANALPVTHGLQAIRAVLDGGSASVILENAGWELAVAAFWLLLAIVTIDRMSEAGRHDGSIEFIGA